MPLFDGESFCTQERRWYDSGRGRKICHVLVQLNWEMAQAFATDAGGKVRIYISVIQRCKNQDLYSCCSRGAKSQDLYSSWLRFHFDWHRLGMPISRGNSGTALASAQMTLPKTNGRWVGRCVHESVEV